MIIKAELSHRQAIVDLMRMSARSQLHKQWDDDENGYPCVRLDGDLRSGNAYIDMEGDCVAAYVCLDSVPPPEYAGIAPNWDRPDEPALYVHRLCVHADMRGKGLAKRFMEFAEDLARENGLNFIRLDSYSRNKIALGLYASLGYERRHPDVYYSRMPDPCFLFEKHI